jgi:predicted transcriptional regulator
MAAKVFRPGMSGAAAVLGPLESDIMDVLWEAPGAQSVGDVHARLNTPRRKISYSAVKAVLNNLATKGHLQKGAIGKATIFRPLKDRDRFEADLVKTVIDSLKSDFGQPAIVQLVNALTTDEEGLAEFEALIAARRAELKP